jgi:two-component system chemotaxis response regulator CheY
MAFNILVVDDSATMRALVRRVVRMSGIAVGEMFEADNGRAALDVLEDNWIDIVLCDINMPVMNGIEMLRRLKASDVESRLPVIFVTTEGGEKTVAEAMALGAAGYVKKPFVPETIKTVMLEALERAYGAVEMDDAAAGGDDMDF